MIKKLLKLYIFAIFFHEYFGFNYHIKKNRLIKLPSIAKENIDMLKKLILVKGSKYYLLVSSNINYINYILIIKVLLLQDMAEEVKS